MMRGCLKKVGRGLGDVQLLPTTLCSEFCVFRHLLIAEKSFSFFGFFCFTFFSEMRNEMKSNEVL